MQIQLTEELGQTRINVQQRQINNMGAGGVIIAVLLIILLVCLSNYLIGRIQAGAGGNSIGILVVVVVLMLGTLYILYDLACRHFNTVEFILTPQGDISITKRPIPSRGMRSVNKIKIRQFFIKRFLNQADYRKVEYLALCMRLKNGITKQLLFERIEDYAALRELETIIEERLGISEAPERDEYRPGILAEQATPRGTIQPMVSEPAKQNTLRLGELDWDILFRKQYDWSNGETVHFLTLGFAQERKYLYQNTAGQYTQLTPLTLAQQLELGLKVSKDQLDYSAHQLRLSKQRTGQLFRSMQQHQPGIDCELAVFRTSREAPLQGNVRVLRFENMLEAYLETSIEA